MSGPTTALYARSRPAGNCAAAFYAVHLQYTSQGVAVLGSALVDDGPCPGCLVRTTLPHGGWRVAFFLGVIIVPFGLWLRNRLPETLHAAAGAPEAPDAPSLPLPG